MITHWLFTATSHSSFKPVIKGQVSGLSKNTLRLYNPWIIDSVFMAKLYTAMTVGLMLYCYSDAFKPDYKSLSLMDTHSLLKFILTPFIFTPFLAYRIRCIKILSDIFLNRSTQKILYLRNQELICLKWKETEGGLLKKREFSGHSFNTSYALAFSTRRSDGKLHESDCLWVDSNEPTEPDIQYVAEVWEYLRHFMDHGLDKLPPPGEPNWWHRPLHAICLTPAEAWRHYAPWRTGEPGEMQGKKNWQLPFWAVLFPYNLTVALCWYVICRLFNVKAAPPPPEAFEEAPARPRKRKRA
ncbi:hypothetical protein [Pseudomonas entomophila]|uniref:hypothetical protein n=1 Tax=Pseudomonas entomophila TaxID=312306 RepID=UPI003EBB3048